MKRGGIGIPYPGKSAERCHAKSVEACEALAESILGGFDLSYVGHRS